MRIEGQSNDGPVTVAINGQINPLNPGGTESSVMSLVRHLSERKDELNVKFISLPEFRDVFERTVPACGVIDWPYPLSRPVSAVVQRPELQRLRRYAGPARPLFDRWVISRRSRELRKGLPDAAKCDAILKAAGVEVVHFGWPVTFPTLIPYVYEPQDLQHCHYPEFFSPESLQWRQRMYRDGCAGARFVVCGTWWTKHDIMKQFGIKSERIAVVPRTSVNASVAVSPAREAEVARELHFEGLFGVYSAMTFPHKNHMRLLEAIRRLRDENGIKVQLICTGRMVEPLRSQILAFLVKHNLQDQIRMLGPVSDEVLTVLLNRATAVVFPSLFEGLSQSLLEAMSKGVPVIAAKQSSIPETVGGGGLFFDGEDVGSIATTLAESFFDSEGLKKLRAAMQREVQRYDWDEASDILTALYRKAAGRALTAKHEKLIACATRLNQ
jgi:glycosyltransferase involved in cell wall biosynthesis